MKTQKSKNIPKLSDLLLKVRVAIATNREDLLPGLNAEIKNIITNNNDDGK